jgi:hypothetical protein
VLKRCPAILAALLAVTLAAATAWAAGSSGGSGTTGSTTCRVLEVSFQAAADDLQVVVWLEDGDGKFLDTLYITRAVGSFGIGNRPGEFDLKSGFRWPYGRRTQSLPIWAHKHGKTYPLIVYEDGRDGSVAYHEEDSSPEAYFCRPLMESEEFCYRSDTGNTCVTTPYPHTSSQAPLGPPFPPSITVDAITCPSVATLSKGRFDTTGKTTVYPPRNDLSTFGDRDSPDIKTYSDLNTLDAVTAATPVSGSRTRVRLPLVRLSDGTYKVQVEANREYDFNDSHNYPSHHDDESIWDDYGIPNLGQPAVLYTVPIQVAGGQAAATRTNDYSGYAAWDGSKGDIQPPDETITLDKDGSGAARLASFTDDAGQPARVAVGTVTATDDGPPPAVKGLTVTDMQPGSVTLSLQAPDVPVGELDLRYRAGEPIDEASFERATPVANVPIGQPGETVTVKVGGLKPQTHYYFGLVARSICGQGSPLALADAQTPRTPYASIHGCFVATAAYGSPLAAEVDLLRQVRDRLLLPTPVGRQLVEAYYATSPPLAQHIATDPELRRAARGLLVPFVQAARFWRDLR